jgi:hypothetical protein
MSSTKLKTGNIVSLEASKLTGTMAAVSGANLTGVSPFTVSASDPTVATNPAGGLGTIWMNSTSGETYILTDATASSNVWTNVGTGFGAYGKAFGGKGPGTVAGFHPAGQNGGGSVVQIDKFLFSSNTTASDHGDLVQGSYAGTGHQY